MKDTISLNNSKDERATIAKQIRDDILALEVNRQLIEEAKEKMMKNFDIIYGTGLDADFGRENFTRMINESVEVQIKEYLSEEFDVNSLFECAIKDRVEAMLPSKKKLTKILRKTFNAIIKN